VCVISRQGNIAHNTIAFNSCSHYRPDAFPVSQRAYIRTQTSISTLHITQSTSFCICTLLVVPVTELQSQYCYRCE